MFKKLLFSTAFALNLLSFYGANSKTPDIEKNKETLNQLYDNKYETAIGNKEAKIVIFDFFDYNCSDCKAIAPILEEIVKNNQDIKVVPIEYPILSSPSMYAAQTAIAALYQGKYEQVHHDFISRVGRFTAEGEVDSAAIKDGVNISKINTDPTIKAYLFKNLELGHKLGITNVPTLLIGNVSEPHNTSVIVEPKPDELLALINKYIK